MERQKVKVLVFEGLDKVGKTTLIGEVHKKTGYKYLCIDRFAATSYAYGKLRKRENLDYDSYAQALYEMLIGFDVKLFFVKAHKKIWWDRMKSSGDNSLEYDEYEELMSLFKQFFGRIKRHSDLEVHEIDTTEKTISESADECVKVIEK